MIAAQADIASLFEGFDLAADAIIDRVIAEADPAGHAAMANGLAIRLVQWSLGSAVALEEAENIANTLVTELTTLKRNITHNMVDQ